MRRSVLADAPEAWRPLLAAIHGYRELRDEEDSCDVFEVGEPGHGDCQTDGHYRCEECRHIEQRELRRRRDQCQDCGTALVFGNPLLGYSARTADCCPECTPWERA